MTLADAIAAPRVHHQALPDTLFYERGGLAPGVVTQLRAMGHIPVERSGYSGEVAAVGRVLGGWIGVIDPRSGGGAVGY
jgi:gamma-glutamyltranspeptidase/glutathione hydrolase